MGGAVVRAGDADPGDLDRCAGTMGLADMRRCPLDDDCFPVDQQIIRDHESPTIWP